MKLSGFLFIRSREINMKTKYIIGFIVGAAVLPLLAIVLIPTPKPQAARPLMGEKMTDQTATHIERGAAHAAYNSDPPTSGVHWGDGVAGAGIKTEQVPDELVLHSMEHGAAVIWYKADLAKDEIAKIQGAFDAAKIAKKIMVPRTNLDVPVALVSWGYLLKQKTLDPAQITAFLLSNNGRGTENSPI